MFPRGMEKSSSRAYEAKKPLQRCWLPKGSHHQRGSAIFPIFSSELFIRLHRTYNSPMVVLVRRKIELHLLKCDHICSQDL